MIDVSEHIYDDDPRHGHPDIRTRLKDASYFLIGNGLVQAAVQFAPGGEGTPLGLLLLDPDRLGKKREAPGFDPAVGLEPTMLRLMTAEGMGRASPGTLSVEWSAVDGVPAVQAFWRWLDLDVRERFFCPDWRTPRVTREIAIESLSGQPREVRLTTGVAGGQAEHTMHVAASGTARAWIMYELSADRRHVSVFPALADPLDPEARDVWAGGTQIAFGHDLLDRFFRASVWQLPAVVSATGRMDASLWQYGREWLRDQAFVALGLLMAGRAGQAALILRRLLREFITAEGSPVDSSEVRAPDETELDQNGVLLYVLGQYVDWTGDSNLVRTEWERIARAAEFPLGRTFRHVPSGMLANRREFWERHRMHGIEPGLELAHQMFVSLGLSSAARLARRIGRDDQAAAWRNAARALRAAFVSHPRYALVDRRGFIKRRGLDGAVQERIAPSPDARLPGGVPLAEPRDHWLNPDTSAVLPIAFEIVSPRSELAARTLASVDTLWNQAWDGGGYGRYHESSEPDSPGPWPFASLFVARATIEAGQPDRAWRVLRWMDSVPGAAAASWFEYYGPRVAPPYPQVGIVPWTWAELIALLVHHVIGVRPEEPHIRLRPRLLPGLDRVNVSIPIRGCRLRVELRTDEGQRAPVCEGAGAVRDARGEWLIPYANKDVSVEVTLPRP